MLKDLISRMENGEFIGQDDGDILRVGSIVEQCSVPVDEVHDVVNQLGYQVVADAIIPRVE